MAVSQNSCEVEKPKPTSFRLVAVTDHTCQTTKATSSAGTAIHRLRAATFLPMDFQKSSFSGSQSVIGLPGRYCSVSYEAGACPPVLLLSWTTELMALP